VLSVAFSPDGQRIVAASRDGTARIWDVQDPALPCPGWFTSWNEGFAGTAIDENGLQVPRALKANEMAGTDPSDPYRQLATWALGRGPQKPAWPGSRRTVGDWIDGRIAEGTEEAVDDAYDALPGDPLVLAASANLQAGKTDMAIFEAHYAAHHATVHAETADGHFDTARIARVCESARAALIRAGLKPDVVGSLTSGCGTQP